MSDSYECVLRLGELEVGIQLFRKLCENEPSKNVNRKIVKGISITYLPNNILLEDLIPSMLEFIFQKIQLGQI